MRRSKAKEKADVEGAGAGVLERRRLEEEPEEPEEAARGAGGRGAESWRTRRS